MGMGHFHNRLCYALLIKAAASRTQGHCSNAAVHVVFTDSCHSFNATAVYICYIMLPSVNSLVPSRGSTQTTTWNKKRYITFGSNALISSINFHNDEQKPTSSSLQCCSCIGHCCSKTFESSSVSATSMISEQSSWNYK